jgi:hypothetical protein
MVIRFGGSKNRRDYLINGFVIKNVTNISYTKMHSVVTITYEIQEGHRLVENYKTFSDINYVIFDSGSYGRMSQFSKYTEYDDFNIDMTPNTIVDVYSDTEQRGTLHITIKQGGRKHVPIDTKARYVPYGKERIRPDDRAQEIDKLLRSLKR